MKPDQLANFHVALAQVFGKDFEQQKRLLLRNLAKVESSTQLDNPSFEKVMAFLEERGFRQKDQPPDYWRRKYRAQGQFCGERMAHLALQLSQQVKYPLDSLVAKASKGRTARVEELNPSEANNLVEMLKSMAARSTGVSPVNSADGGLNTKARRHEGQLVSNDLFGNPDIPHPPKIEDRRSKIETCATAVSAVPVTDDEVPF